MATKEFTQIENILYDYPDLESEIKRRKTALAFPVREHDENIGGSHASGGPSEAERYVVTLDQDKRLRLLEDQLLQIKRCLIRISPEERKVIEVRYFNPETRKASWERVSEEVQYYSKTQCLRIRNKFVLDLGKSLGLID